MAHLFISQSVLRFFSQCFLRTVIQTHLVGFLPSFLVTSHDVPAAKPRGILKEVVGAFYFLSATFPLEFLANVTQNRLMKILVDTLFPVHLY